MAGASVCTGLDTMLASRQAASTLATRAMLSRKAMIFAARSEPRAMRSILGLAVLSERSSNDLARISGSEWAIILRIVVSTTRVSRWVVVQIDSLSLLGEGWGEGLSANSNHNFLPRASARNLIGIHRRIDGVEDLTRGSR